MAYGDRRQPWHPSGRRTYTRPASRASKQLGVGRTSRAPTVIRGEHLTSPLHGRRGVGDLVSTVVGAAGNPVAAIEAAVPGISSLFSSADGGPNDKRVTLLAQAYQQAAAGLNVATPYPGTGLPYLQNWLADNPPHPSYSNQIAQQLITAIINRNPNAAAGAVPVSLDAPVNPATGMADPSTYAGVPGVGGISPLLLVAGVGALVLLLRK